MKRLLATCLLLTLACSAQADDSPVRLPLVGYNEHRTNLLGGRHVNVSTNRAMVAKADGTERRSIGISEQSHDSWRLLEAAVNWSVEADDVAVKSNETLL